MEYYSAIEINEILFCSKMDATGGHYVHYFKIRQS